MGKGTKFLICTKGSPVWGLGHLFRVKVFVRQLLDLGEDIEVVALVSVGVENVLTDIAEVVSFIYKEIEFVKIVEKKKPDTIIFDMVSIDDEIFQRLACSKKVSISPVFSHSESMDLVFTREKKLHDLASNPKIFGGLEFAIFNDRVEFISDEQYMKNLVQNEISIAISMGGGDAPNKSLRILKELAQIESPCTFWLILGEGYAHSYQELVNSIKIDNKHEIILARTNRSMWRILSNCSLAILAGGLTTLEAIYAGLPSVNIFEKEEHLTAMASEIWESKACLSGGSFNGQNLVKLRQVLTKLLNKKSILLELRENSKGLLNKYSSIKIFDIIKKECACAESI